MSEAIELPEFVVIPTGDIVDEFCRGAGEVGFLSYDIFNVIQAGVWANGDPEKIHCAASDVIDLFRSEDMPSNLSATEFLQLLTEAFYAELWKRMKEFGVAEDTHEDVLPRYVAVGVDSRHCVVLQERSRYERRHHPSTVSQASR